MRTQKNDKKEATSILRCLLLDCMIRKMFVLSLEKRRSLKKNRVAYTPYSLLTSSLIASGTISAMSPPVCTACRIIVEL